MDIGFEFALIMQWCTDNWGWFAAGLVALFIVVDKA